MSGGKYKDEIRKEDTKESGLNQHVQMRIPQEQESITLWMRKLQGLQKHCMPTEATEERKSLTHKQEPPQDSHGILLHKVQGGGVRGRS